MEVGENEALCIVCKFPFIEGDAVVATANSNDPDTMNGLVHSKCFDERVAPHMSFEFRVAPTQGNFKPIRTSEEINAWRSTSIQGEQWDALERTFLEYVMTYGPRLFEIVLYGKTAKGYRFRPMWGAPGPIGLRIPGTSKKLGLVLDIYQVHRLLKLGLHPIEGAVEEWAILFTPAEQNFENLVRVMTHVAQYGYLLELHKFHEISPIVDTKS